MLFLTVFFLIFIPFSIGKFVSRAGKKLIIVLITVKCSLITLQDLIEVIY
jgi:hypothetical protein